MLQTVVYKQHTITMDRHQQWTNWLSTFTCTPITPPWVTGTWNTGTYNSATAPWLLSAEQARLTQIKAQIDALPPAWGGWEEWTTTQNHTAPNGNVYVITIYADGHVTFPSQAPGHEWEEVSQPSLNAAIAFIDTNNPVTWGWSGDNTVPWQWTYPMPTIVFGAPAEVPQAGPWYQAARNDAIAAMILPQMVGPYTTWDQAHTDFDQKVMVIVNSHGWNVQINNQHLITSLDDTDYGNTIWLIKTKLWTLKWVSWRDWFVTWWTGTWTGEWTANTDIAATTQTIQDNVNEMNGRLTSSFNANLTQRQNALANVPDFAPQIADRITSLNQSFQTAWGFLQAWADLQSKAQAIYSNQNINNMKQQLVSKWFDIGKAAPAVFFQAMKDRANLSAEIYKIQADEQKTLADLESKRGQLVDWIKAAGIEADQWVFSQVQELNKQITTLRNNYDAAKIANESNFIMKPLLDVLSNQRQADMQNLIDKYQEQYLNANPSQKIVAVGKLLGDSWAYVDSAVALDTHWTFWEYFARCAWSAREWKIAEAAAWADTNITTWWSWDVYTT